MLPSASASQLVRFAARGRAGKAKTGILLWLLGVPIPLILLFFLFRGCLG